jgi:hypothetical protein
VDRIQHAFETVLGRTIQQMLLPAWLRALPTPGNRRYTRGLRVLLDEVDGLIAVYLTDQGCGESARADLLYMLIAARDDHSENADGHGRMNDAELQYSPPK